MLDFQIIEVRLMNYINKTRILGIILKLQQHNNNVILSLKSYFLTNFAPLCNIIDGRYK